MPSKILVHVTHGPEHPTRAALAFAVAKAALDEGHQVSVFLAGDAVQLIREGVLDSLAGLGTGNLRQAYGGIVAGGGPVLPVGRLQQGTRGDGAGPCGQTGRCRGSTPARAALAGARPDVHLLTGKRGDGLRLLLPENLRTFL